MRQITLDYFGDCSGNPIYGQLSRSFMQNIPASIPVGGCRISRTKQKSFYLHFWLKLNHKHLNKSANSCSNIMMHYALPDVFHLLFQFEFFLSVLNPSTSFQLRIHSSILQWAKQLAAFQRLHFEGLQLVLFSPPQIYRNFDIYISKIIKKYVFPKWLRKILLVR